MRYPGEPCRPDDASRCLAQAREELEPYADSIVEPLFSRYGLNFPPDWIKVRAAARKEVLHSPSPICQRLSGIVDDLKRNGRQHIFLFSLIPGNEDRLKSLDDRDRLLELLAKNGREAALGRNTCVLRSDIPVLAEVRYRDPAAPDALFFKWVETRSYKELVGNTFKDREERSANFFILDFPTGRAELRLQILRANPGKRLAAEYATYVPEIARYIGLDAFSIVLLEPIMKLFISDAILPITSWRFKSEHGALEGTRMDRAYLSMLKIPLSRFFAHELSVVWGCPQDSTKKARNQLPFTFNGYNNSVSFKAVSDATKVDFVLDVVRDISLFTKKYGAIAIRELRELADRYPLDHSVLHMIDYHFDRLRWRELAESDLVTEYASGGRPQAILEVFQRAAGDFPYKFRLLNRDGHAVLTMEFLFRTIGLLDVLAIRFPRFRARRLGKAAIRLSILPLMGIIRVAGMSFAKHSAGRYLESSIGIPVIALELALYALVILMFYSTKRIKKLSIRAIYVLRSALRKAYRALPALPRAGRWIRKRLIKLRVIERGSRGTGGPISESHYLVWLQKLGLTKDKRQEAEG